MSSPRRPQTLLPLFLANDSRGGAPPRNRPWHGVVRATGRLSGKTPATLKSTPISPYWAPKTFEYSPGADTEDQIRTDTFADAQHLAGKLNLKLRSAEEADRRALERWIGEDFDPKRATAEVKKLVRADLARASLKPGPLRGCTFDVRVSGHHLVVVVDPPKGTLVVNARRVGQDEGYARREPSAGLHSARGSAVIGAVEAIANRYNQHRESFYDYGFQLSVRFPEGLTDAQREEIRRDLEKAHGPRSRR